MGTVNTPTSNPPVAVELEVRDRECFFVDASAALQRRVTLEEFVNRSDGRLLEYFTIEGDPDVVLSMAHEATPISSARLVQRGADLGLFEFVVSGQCVTATLADTGAMARSVTAENGVGRVVADVPPHVEVRRVVEQFEDRHPGSALVGRRDSDRPAPVQTRRGAQVTLTDHLTSKQREALRTAFVSGYFSWPRRSTAAECAEALGISQPTFSQHLRVAQEKVFGRLFESPPAEE
jgi:predicted DNA binding protein